MAEMLSDPGGNLTRNVSFECLGVIGTKLEQTGAATTGNAREQGKATVDIRMAYSCYEDYWRFAVLCESRND